MDTWCLALFYGGGVLKLANDSLVQLFNSSDGEKVIFIWILHIFYGFPGEILS